jgi:hypothetical protein
LEVQGLPRSCSIDNTYQQNKNIHFHILADKRFDIGYCNALWIKQQRDAGIINYRSEQKIYKAIGKTFTDLYRDRDFKEIQNYLNPFDAEKVNDIDGVSAYLTNYVTKNTDSFECAAWHNSRTVSKLFTNAIIPKSLFDLTSDHRLNRITGDAIDKETGERYRRTFINKTYYGQYCTLNSIYNKRKFRKYLNDMESVNRYILEFYREPLEVNQDGDLVRKNIDRELVVNEIQITKDEFRDQYYELSKNAIATKKESFDLVKCLRLIKPKISTYENF